MKKAALLVIDVQEGIVNDPDFPMLEPDLLLERINRVIEAVRRVDWPIVFIRHTEGDDSPLQANAPAWQLDARLSVQAKDVIFNKTTPDSFYQTGLLEWLSAQGLTDVIVCGLQTDYCIDTTTRSAFSHDLSVTLIADAHSTCDSGDLNASAIIAHHNRVLGSWFAQLIPTDELIQSIQ
jgi:nicotinamidase-related amidase